MKKILTTVAGLIALSMTAACGSAVDTQETTSTSPIAVSTVSNQRVQDIRKEIQEFKASRNAARPEATPKVSHHENHVNHVQLLNAAAKAKKLAEAKAVKKKIVKVKKTVQPKIKKKTVKAKKVVDKVKKTYTKAKKVSLSGIASCIAKYESGGNPRAQNPHSSASGLFQFVDGTWNHFGGYARAMYAPVSVQLKKFYQVWDNGRGAHHWVVAHKCGY